MNKIYYATVTFILSLHIISIVKIIQNTFYDMELYDKLNLIDNISMIIITFLYILYIVNIYKEKKIEKKQAKR